MFKAEVQKDIKDIIYKYFSTDPELITTYHLMSGTDLETCVNRTYDDLKDSKQLEFFEIYKDNKPIGFFGKESNKYLTTIFILPENRNKEDLLGVFNLIKSYLDKHFLTALYKKNTRAINFYLKNGAKVIHSGEVNNTEFVLLEFKEV